MNGYRQSLLCGLIKSWSAKKMLIWLLLTGGAALTLPCYIYIIIMNIQIILLNFWSSKPFLFLNFFFVYIHCHFTGNHLPLLDTSQSYLCVPDSRKTFIPEITEIILLKAHAQIKAHPLFFHISEFYEAQLSHSHKGPLPTSSWTSSKGPWAFKKMISVVRILIFSWPLYKSNSNKLKRNSNRLPVTDHIADV